MGWTEAFHIVEGQTIHHTCTQYGNVDIFVCLGNRQSSIHLCIRSTWCYRGILD